MKFQSLKINSQRSLLKCWVKTCMLDSWSFLSQPHGFSDVPFNFVSHHFWRGKKSIREVSLNKWSFIVTCTMFHLKRKKIAQRFLHYFYLREYSVLKIDWNPCVKCYNNRTMKIVNQSHFERVEFISRLINVQIPVIHFAVVLMSWQLKNRILLKMNMEQK